MNEKRVSQGFMFDTNIFNRILDDKIKIGPLTQFPLYMVHIQPDELDMAKCIRREKLLKIFRKIPQRKIPTESIVLGISRFGGCKFSDGTLYDNIKKELDSRKKKANNIQDALIADTAIKNKLILVTNDKNLRETVNGLQGKAITLSEFQDLNEKGVKP